jgi:hypothetical protein
LRPFLRCRYNPAVAVGVPYKGSGKFAQVTAETVMSMSAPSRETFDVRALEIDANGLLSALSQVAGSPLASDVSWSAVDEDEDDDEDWDDDDEDDDDEDDDEEWDDEDEEDDDEDELGWDDEDEDEEDDEEE